MAAVFEERATQFSDDLLALLKSLFDEGVRIGRDSERSINAEIVRRLDLVAFKTKQEAVASLGERIVALHSKLPLGNSLTPNDIRRAVREFEQHESSPIVPYIAGIDLGIGSDETVVTTGTVNPWTSQGPSLSSLENFSMSDKSFRSQFIQEIHGAYVDRSSGTPTESGSSPSEDDPPTGNP
jgi:hypothetical protein